MRTPGLMISAPASGTGKTTVMLGLLRAFADMGRRGNRGRDGKDTAFGAAGFAESALYAPDYDRRFRPQSADSIYKDSRA
jgi:Mrp family chromosome partitioning ATPase